MHLRSALPCLGITATLLVGWSTTASAQEEKERKTESRPRVERVTPPPRAQPAPRPAPMRPAPAPAPAARPAPGARPASEPRAARPTPIPRDDRRWNGFEPRSPIPGSERTRRISVAAERDGRERPAPTTSGFVPLPEEMDRTPGMTARALTPKDEPLPIGRLVPMPPDSALPQPPGTPMPPGPRTPEQPAPSTPPTTGNPGWYWPYFAAWRFGYGASAFDCIDPFGYRATTPNRERLGRAWLGLGLLGGSTFNSWYAGSSSLDCYAMGDRMLSFERHVTGGTDSCAMLTLRLAAGYGYQFAIDMPALDATTISELYEEIHDRTSRGESVNLLTSDGVQVKVSPDAVEQLKIERCEG